MRDGRTLFPAVPDAATAVRTFLIADVRGYTRFTLEHGDRAAALLAGKFALVAREVVTSREGEVIELRGDEALAVFSSARQALWAAAELQGRFGQESLADPALPLSVGIGIDAGEAIPVEDGYRGAALNLAARLCSLAGPGEVLASDAVVHLARRIDGLAYLQRGLVELKGFADPVQVIEIHPAPTPVRPEVRPGPPGTASDRIELEEKTRLPIGGFLGSLPAGPLLSRDTEMAAIEKAVDAVVADGQGQFLLLAGEPGVGKTRLAQEATLLARNRTFTVAVGRCYEPQQSVAFYPFLEALSALVAASPLKIQTQVSRRWPEMQRLLPGAPSPLNSGMFRGTDDKQRLFWTVANFVETVAGTTPVAFFLDDLQWADSSSLDLLQHLARYTRSRRVLFVGTFRPFEVHRNGPLAIALRDLEREGILQRIQLERLTRAGTAELLAQTIGVEVVSDAFADLIHTRTEGNPMYVQQVTRVLVERGDLYRQDGHWLRRELEEIEVPESIRAVIGQRLSRLSEKTQEALREGSILGRSFTFDELQRLSGLAEDVLEGMLEEAVGTGLLREAGKDRYAFDGTLVQQTLYTHLGSRRRRRLHLAAGETLEREPESTRWERVNELAWHFLEADDRPRALRYSLAAGDAAEAKYAHAEAEAQYRIALTLLDDFPAGDTAPPCSKVEALEKLGGVLLRLARYDEALGILDEAAGLYATLGDGEGELRALAQIGLAHVSRQSQIEGVSRLEPVLAARAKRAPSPGSVDLAITLAILLFGTGRYPEMCRVAEGAVEAARALADDRLLVRAEARLGLALQMLGRADEALAIYERLRTAAERVDDLETLGISLNNAAAIREARGDTATSTAYLERALEVWTRLGDPARIAWALGTVGGQAFLRGDWSRARAHWEEAARITRTLSGSRSGWSAVSLGSLRLYEGETEAAVRYLQELAADAERAGDPSTALAAEIALADHDLEEGRPADALSRLEPLLADPNLEEFATVNAQQLIARILLDLGDVTGADDLLRTGMERPASRDNMLVSMDWLRVEGKVRERQRRWEAATHALDSALATARNLSFPFGEALVLRDYGTMLVRKGAHTEGRRRLEEARAVFTRLGARPYIERTDRVLFNIPA